MASGEKWAWLDADEEEPPAVAMGAGGSSGGSNFNGMLGAAVAGGGSKITTGLEPWMNSCSGLRIRSRTVVAGVSWLQASSLRGLLLNSSPLPCDRFST